MQKLSVLLADKGFLFSPTFDGQYQRNGSQWYRGVQIQAGDKTVYVARFGDWKQDTRFEWVSDQPADPAEARALADALDSFQKGELEEKREVQEWVAWEARLKLLNAIDRGTTPYLERKQIPKLLGAKIDPERPDRLLVPAQDIQGKIWGYQRILATKIQVGDDWVDKFFLKGMRIEGCFHLIGELPSESELQKPILVAEGFATAASLHLATGYAVCAAFNAGNLESVCRTLRGAHPHARIVVCGDDDRFTKRPNGTPWNPGREKATAAAASVGGLAVFPLFPRVDRRDSDFNDLHALGGLSAVTEQVEAALRGEASEAEEPTVGPTAADGGPGPESATENGPGAGVPDAGAGGKAAKKKRFSEKLISDRLMGHYGPNIIRQNKSLFLYDGKRWREVDLAMEDRIKNHINALCGDTLPSKEVVSIYRTFFRYVPPVPEGVNLFNPNPTCANFENGTLHIRQSADHHYRLEFLPHRREDYVINLLPYEYDPERKAKNPHFTEMLERVFQGDSDAAEKIRSVRQMYGACLVPFRPHLFMLHGKPKTGKSTVIQIAEKMVSPENLCSVEPHQFHGFNMESMVGKLVNSDTDITTDAPISEANVKKIIDRRMFRIRRKGIADAYGFLPGVHIFGGNGIPPTLDGAHRAHDRRWTFIEFKHPQGVGKYDIEYWLWVWEQSPHGVINFAIEGLEDLLQERGHYLNPESGKAKMDEWQTNTDPVELFLRDARAGVLELPPERDKSGNIVDSKTQVRVGETYRVKQPLLWGAFVTWHLDTFQNRAKVSRIAFYAALREKGYPTVTIGGYDHFSGIGNIEVPNSHF